MGINTVSANTQQTFNGVAGSAITAGDLVVNSEAGLFYPASAVLTMTQNNNTTAGITAISAISSVISLSGYGNTSQTTSPVIAQLGNGNIVSLYNGDGTTGTTNLNVYIRNIQGANVVSPITISDSSISYFRVKTLNSSSFVVSWIASSSMRFAIYSNSGTVIKSTTTVASVGSATTETWSVEALVGGNIVFAYYSAAAALSYAIYDSTGTAVLAPTVAEAGASPDKIFILRQTGGGFIIYYRNSSTTYKFARYNASGVLQGSITTIAAPGGVGFSGCLDGNVGVELANENVVFCAPNSSGYPFYYVYSSTGSLIVGSLDVSNSSSTISYPNIIPGMCATTTGFAVVTPTNNGSARYFNVFDTSGTFLIQRKIANVSSIGGYSSSSNLNYLRIFSNGAAGLTVHEQVVTGGCSTTYQTNLYSFDLSGTQRGSVVVLQASFTSQSTNLCGVSLNDGSIAVTHRYSSGVGTTYWGSYAMLRKSIVGIAQNTVSLYSTANVFTQGNFTINQNMGFGGYFDNRTATVPGTRGTVVGTNVVLLGYT